MSYEQAFQAQEYGPGEALFGGLRACCTDSVAA